MAEAATKKETVFTVEQAKALAKRIKVSEQTVLEALGLQDPRSSEISPSDRIRVEACISFDEAWGLYGAAPRKSGLEHLALSKCLELVTTFDQAEDVYETALQRSEIERLAIRRMAELM